VAIFHLRQFDNRLYTFIYGRVVHNAVVKDKVHVVLQTFSRRNLREDKQVHHLTKLFDLGNFENTDGFPCSLFGQEMVTSLIHESVEHDFGEVLVFGCKDAGAELSILAESHGHNWLLVELLVLNEDGHLEGDALVVTILIVCLQIVSVLARPYGATGESVERI
jgi:hypothetical protein